MYDSDIRHQDRIAFFVNKLSEKSVKGYSFHHQVHTCQVCQSVPWTFFHCPIGSCGSDSQMVRRGTFFKVSIVRTALSVQNRST